MQIGDIDMPHVSSCPGFESFGSDVQQAREAVKMPRRVLAEKVGIDPRYLANIELAGTIPSVPIMIKIVRICKLSADRYFNPELIREDSEQWQRTNHKLKLCPEKYLPIVEGVIDGAIKLKDEEDTWKLSDQKRAGAAVAPALFLYISPPGMLAAASWLRTVWIARLWTLSFLRPGRSQ